MARPGKSGAAQRATEFATRHPRGLFWLTGLIAVLAIAQFPRIHIDTDPENMLPGDQPERVFNDRVEQRFGLHDAIVVGLVNEQHPQGIYNAASLTALHRLTQAILELDGVIRPDLMSLATADNIRQARDGAIRFEWMMKEPPTSDAEALRIRQQVDRLPLLKDTLVSGDGQAAAIYVPIESKDLSYRISQQIEALADGIVGDDALYITGLPVAEDTFGVEMFIQMGISAPLAGLMIFLLMWYFFRSWQLIVAPMIVAMVTVIATMGLLIGLGFTVHIMSSMIPIFLMPIAVVDSVHIMSEFVDRYRHDEGAAAAIRQVIAQLYRPMLFTSLTSAVGFASLLLTPIPPVQVFGAFVAFGILLAFLLTILFIPAYVVRLKPDSLAALKARRPAESLDSPLARGLRRTGRFAFGQGRLIASLALLVAALSAAGILRIEINDNPVRWFKESHRIRVADRVLNEHFAGTYDAFLVLEHDDPAALAAFRDAAGQLLDSAAAAGSDVSGLRGQLATLAPGGALDEFIAAVDDALFAAAGNAADALDALLSQAEQFRERSRYFQDPSALALIERLQSVLAATGRVGKASALPDVVKVVNRELHGGDPADYRIPDSAAGVAQTLLQYQSSHRPQDLWHMVTPDLRSASLWLQLTSGDNQHMSAVTDALAAWLADHPLPPGLHARWAGKTYINVVWQREMVRGMLRSLLGAFLVVFAMMWLLFRSLRFGLLAMLPLTLTIVAVYGLIGWIGKDYDMPIAVLSSLTLGLSIDFAIHFLQRMRSLYAACGSFSKAAQEIFEEPGRAIARNAIVIALGFTPLFLAPLVPYVTVGAFMASIMALSGLATLVLLPAIIGWWRPGMPAD
ncbi:MAG: RND transporter [Gammaproteobacteria bacterium]|nr:MAG: RND transporter [Gammaproteobacteria bacterium]